jgi:hypothetical protein
MSVSPKSASLPQKHQSVTYLLQFRRHPAPVYVEECSLTLFLKNGANQFDPCAEQFKSDADASIAAILICRTDRIETIITAIGFAQYFHCGGLAPQLLHSN